MNSKKAKTNLVILRGGLALFFCLFSFHSLFAVQPTFRRGDVNDDGFYDISDPVRILIHLFKQGPPPANPDAADANDDGSIDLSDAVFLLSWLFLGGSEPKAPYPNPGFDPTPDGLNELAGVFIGPEGGTVESFDGKVKLSIPKDALSKDTLVKIAAINSQDLSAPVDKTILTAVQCLPYDLVFNKDVDLIYKLVQAVVPGTRAELALLRGNDFSFEQASVVQADGYTLSFKINHFSTYAALTSLISQGAPIGTGVKIPLPDMLTGSFSHPIPLTIPPGRKGMQPSLALTYRSSNPNSWVGVGFSLNPGYIVRSTRLGPPTYIDTTDTFYLITDAGTTELVYLVDNPQDNSKLFQAKVESSFSRFYKMPDDSWKAVGKDGSTLFFGQAADSKETSQRGAFSWYITKAEDTNGNYIQYNYTKDQNKAYLATIDYTGHPSASPKNSIEFITKPRPDTLSSYISSSKITTARRLETIIVRANGELVWEYELKYGNPSQDTNRSLLRSITQKGSDSKELPTQTFTYQTSEGGI